MSISATSSTGMRRLAAFYGRSQQVTVLVAIVLATITIVQGIQSTTDSGLLSAFDDLYLVAELDRQGKATQEDARTASKALGSLWQHNPAFVILVFIIPFVSGTWLLMLIGCIAFPVTSIISPSRFQHVGILWRTGTASGLLVVFAIWIIVFIAQGVLIGVAEAKAARSGQIFPLENDPLMITILALMLLAMTKAGLITANLLRDIVHYLATDSAGRPLATQQAIQTELWRVIEQLRSDRDFRKIVMVAHSLGTVILVDLLRNRARETPTADPIHIDIVTAGSPLLRLIYRFLPNRLPAPATIYSELTQSKTIRVSRWLNIYRPLDYVGQALNRRIDPADGILDRPLRPRLVPPFGHANYWGDSRFLDFITSEVIRSSQSSQHQAHARTATY